MSFCENCGVKKYKKRFCSKKCCGQFKSKNFCFIDKQELKKLYEKERVLVIDIAKIYKCSITTVYKYINKHKLKKHSEKYNDYTGKKIGCLKILKPLFPKTSGKHVQWKCKCDCGKICYILSSNFKVLKNQSCKECSFKKLKRKSKYISGVMFQGIKNAARSRNLKFDLDIDYLTKLVDLQNSKCALSGIKLEFAKNAKDHQIGKTTASLDRIDSSKGYTKDNVQWTHKWVNIMKWDFNEIEFYSFCKKVVNTLKKKYKSKMQRI